MLGPQGCLLRLSEVAFWTIFEILGGLVIYSSYQVNVTTYLESFLFLCVCAKKGFSSGGTVWPDTWPSRASIMAPVHARER